MPDFHPPAEDMFELLPRNGARPEQPRPARVAQVDDRRLQADLRGAAVEDMANLPAEPLPHMLRRRGAHASESIGAGGRERLPGQRQQAPK